jgi:hypothetical protein
MKDLLVLLVHLLTTVAKLLGPGGSRAIVADSLLMKQQLLIVNRSRQRAPNLSVLDRFLLGFWSFFLNQHHLQRAAVIIRPSTLLKFHNLLKQRKYRLLYSSACSKRKPGPKGPSLALIQTIVEMKQLNPIIAKNLTVGAASRRDSRRGRRSYRIGPGPHQRCIPESLRNILFIL